MKRQELSEEGKYEPMWAVMKFVSPKRHKTLVELCQCNDWIKKHGLAFHNNPFLESDSPYRFCEFEDVSMLKLFFEYGNWSIRQGVVYRDLFFCNQVNGGDEWWTCRYDHETGAYFPFESVSMRLIIHKGEFESLLADMLEATVEQCKRLEYSGRSQKQEGASEE